MQEGLTILIPIWWRDKDRVSDTIVTLKRFLNPSKIILAGPISMKEEIPTDELVEYIDGNTVVPGMSKEAVVETILKRQREAGVEESPYRAGWLFQQFIKLGFARYSEDSEYLVWDADVLILDDFQLYSEGKPKFFLYDRHMHIEYLPTIEKLFGQKLNTQGEYTFVNHYMMFESEFVREMLDAIDANQNVEGSTWWEKCVNAIPMSDLTKSGFSEFETYGEYMINKHPEVYSFEMGYNHLLCTKRYFGEILSEEKANWLSHCFKTCGFEGYDHPDEYWMARTQKAYEAGKEFSEVENADVFRQRIKGYWNSIKRKLGLNK